jgi:hypothetical protein
MKILLVKCIETFLIFTTIDYGLSNAIFEPPNHAFAQRARSSRECIWDFEKMFCEHHERIKLHVTMILNLITNCYILHNMLFGW